MTSLAQVTALVDAHVSRDQARFRAITLQIAASVASRSERGADQLRKLVDRQQAVMMVPLSSAAGLLSAPHDLAPLDDVVLASSLRERIDRIVLEYARRDELGTRGLAPARKLLFTGPPGCGKTMSTGALARAVGLPMFRVELHGVIGSYLGETAGKLAKVFEHVSALPAVYLFDEFDAIGADRSSSGNESAGGEMRRVVNSLLQFIEDDRSDSLIVAATNHAQVLDKAIFRRFDEVVAFATPSRDELVTLLRRKIGEDAVAKLDVDVVFGASTQPKIGHADICAALDRVLKDCVLAGSRIDTESVVAAITRRTAATFGEVLA